MLGGGTRPRAPARNRGSRPGARAARRCPGRRRPTTSGRCGTGSRRRRTPARRSTLERAGHRDRCARRSDRRARIGGRLALEARPSPADPPCAQARAAPRRPPARGAGRPWRARAGRASGRPPRCAALPGELEGDEAAEECPTTCGRRRPTSASSRAHRRASSSTPQSGPGRLPAIAEHRRVLEMVDEGPVPEDERPRVREDHRLADTGQLVLDQDTVDLDATHGAIVVRTGR